MLPGEPIAVNTCVKLCKMDFNTENIFFQLCKMDFNAKSFLVKLCKMDFNTNFVA